MRSASTKFPWFIAVVVPLLAGCAEQAQIQSQDPDATLVSADEGLVRGVVVDDQQLPVADVSVGLLAKDTNRTGMTGPNGAFQFEAVVPGEYDLVAAKVGYVTATLHIRALANAIVDAQLTVLPLPPPNQAEKEVFFQTGFIACHANIGFWTIVMNTVCSLDPNHKPLFEFQVERSRGLVAIVLELDWTPTTAATGAQVRQELWKNPNCSATSCDPERRFGYAQGPPALKKVYGSLATPFVEDIDALGPTTLGSFVLAPNTEDYTGTGAVFQQPVTHYVSVFYNDEPPADYSAAPSPS